MQHVYGNAAGDLVSRARHSRRVFGAVALALATGLLAGPAQAWFKLSDVMTIEEWKQTTPQMELGEGMDPHVCPFQLRSGELLMRTHPDCDGLIELMSSPKNTDREAPRVAPQPPADAPVEI
ncbi:MAG: hypothetical protein AAFV27_07460 [Pseudomonadota bacterium]